jgi:histidyl-tRNA synthetase
MFRAERPQKGRLRQFHQIGVEVIGSRSIYSDAEVIQRLRRLLTSFGLDEAVIKINSLGCREDKERFADKLRGYLNDRKSRLCDDCKARIDKNIFRTLDCKSESCRHLLGEAPNILDGLCGPCKAGYGRLKEVLGGLDVPFVEAKNLVRGLDYYTGTVFEVTHPALGAQDAIGAGGRYDNLVKDMGGPDAGAIGFALGIERIILAIKAKAPKARDLAVVYIATLGDAAKLAGIRLAEELRLAMKALPLTGFVVFKDIGETSLKSQLRNADKNGARYVVIIGEDEMKNGKAKLKDMVEKKEHEVAIASVAGELKGRLC